MSAPTVSDVVATALAGAGSRFVFGLPGGENLTLMEATERAGLEYVLTKREGSAAFMADMYGQMTGRPGVCLSTLGPGSTNLVNGVAQSFLDRSPMIAISAQVHTARLVGWTHQNVDHLKLFAPVTKLSAAVSAQAPGKIMRRALRLAVAPRPGPVHLDLSSDVAGAVAADGVGEGPQRVISGWPVVVAGNGDPDPVARLRASRAPLVVAGLSAAREPGAPEAITALAEAWGMPVVTTAKAKGVIAEDHPYFGGVVDMAAPKVVAGLIASADLILAVGFDAVELIKEWTYRAPVVHIDQVPNTDQVYEAEIEWIGAIAPAVAYLAAEARGGPRWSTEHLAEHRREIMRALDGGADASTSGLSPLRVVLEAREAFPDETIATVDVGSHKLLVGQAWSVRRPQLLFQSNGLSAMGFAFPAAIAAAMTEPERPVLCLVGDGGFSMAVSDLETAVQRRLSFTTIVLSDASLNRIQLKQQQRGMPAIGTTTMRGHFARVADAYGATGLTARNPRELTQALATSRSTDGPVVIEAWIDPDEYVRQF